MDERARRGGIKVMGWKGFFGNLEQYAMIVALTKARNPLCLEFRSPRPGLDSK